MCENKEKRKIVSTVSMVCHGDYWTGIVGGRKKGSTLGAYVANDNAISVAMGLCIPNGHRFLFFAQQ